MTAHFRLPWSFADFRFFWESGPSLLPANGRSSLDGEPTRAADAYFSHALLTYPLNDALLSSAASFSHSLATRAFDFAGPGGLEQIMQRPDWGHVDTTVIIDDPLAPIPTGDPDAALIWTIPDGGPVVPPHPFDWSAVHLPVIVDDPLAPIPTGDPDAALIWSHLGGSPRATDWERSSPSPFPDATAQTGASASVGADQIAGDAGRNALDFGSPGDLVRGMVDYSRADYCLQLDHTLMPQLGALGALAQEAFHIGSAAADASDRIIYNSATGALYYDPDGAGSAAQVHIANLSPGLSLTAGIFVII